MAIPGIALNRLEGQNSRQIWLYSLCAKREKLSPPPFPAPWAMTSFYLPVATTTQLTLSNGANVQILGASGFGYQVGANAPAGDTASSQTYAQFAATLGASVPTGSTSVSGTANFVVPTSASAAAQMMAGEDSTTSSVTLVGLTGIDATLESGMLTI